MCTILLVVARLKDAAIEQEWVRWIGWEHFRELSQLGVTGLTLDRFESEDGSVYYAASWTFSDGAALTEYLERHAPELRQRSAAKFPADQVEYERHVGRRVVGVSTQTIRV